MTQSTRTIFLALVLCGCGHSEAPPAPIVGAATVAPAVRAGHDPLVIQTRIARADVERTARDPQTVGGAQVVAVQAAEAAGHAGVRLANLRAGGVFARMGLQEGDVITSVAGQPIAPSGLSVSLLDDGVVSDAPSLVMGGTRAGRELLLVVTLEGTALFHQRAAANAVNPGAEVVNGIRRISDTEFQVDRAIYENVQRLLTQVRLIPDVGPRGGVKLFGIRPGSAAALLGLQNGDSVKSVNGRGLSSPEQALETYASLRSASRLRVEIERRGEPLTLQYVVQ